MIKTKRLTAEDIKFSLLEKMVLGQFSDLRKRWTPCNLNFLCKTVSSRNYQIKTKDILRSGLIPVVSQGQNLIEGYSNDKEKAIKCSSNEPLIIFGDHTKNVKYIDFNFIVGADGVKILKPNKSVNSKYLFHLILAFSKKLRNRGYARHFALLKDESFVVPPLEEQKRIVDKLNKLEPLLKQYEDIENKLSNLEDNIGEWLKKSILYWAFNHFHDNVEIKPLWSITTWDKRFKNVDKKKQKKICRFKHVQARDLKILEDPAGSITLLSTGKYYGKTTNKIAVGLINEGEIIALPSGGVPNVKYFNGKFVDANNLLATSSDNKLFDLKYIYYFLLSNNNFLVSNYKGEAIKHPHMAKILELNVPIPSIKKQKKIVNNVELLLKLLYS